MALNDVIEVRFVCLAGLQVSLNVFHYKLGIILAPEPSRQAIATALDAIFAPLYKAVISSAATYRGVGVRRVLPAPRTIEDVAVGNAGIGTLGPDLLPKQVSGLISLRTAEATRRGRGRKYVPFASETDNTAAGAPTVAYGLALTNLAANFDDQQTVVAGGGSVLLDPVLFRRSDGTTRTITLTISRSSWATQRRRGDLGRTNLSPF